jgi:integrase
MNINLKSVKALKDVGRDTIYFDDDVRRFGIRVRPGGAKSYLIKYRNAQGRQRKVTIGTHGTWTPEQARDKAKELLRAVDGGTDVAESKLEHKNAITIAQLVDEYYQAARDGKRSTWYRKKPVKASTLDTDETRVRRHIIPLLGNKLVRDLTTQDAESFVEAVTQGKTAGEFVSGKKRGLARVTGGAGTARRTFANLSVMISYAIRVGHLPKNTTNPCFAVKFEASKRKRISITDQQYAKFGEEIQKANRLTQNIAILIALTGLRKNEAVRLKRSEVDFEHRCICLDDSKSGFSVRALGQAAIDHLRSVMPNSGIYLFSASGSDKPYGGFSKRFREAVEGLTPHAFRHGYATLAHIGLGVSELVVAHILGHQTAKSTTQGYIDPPNKIVLQEADKVSKHIYEAMKLRLAANMKEMNTNQAIA